MKREAEAGKLRLLDLGVGYDADAFWINLRPGAFGADRRAAWLQRDELRRAISMAVDRQLFADTVFLGAALPAYGPITPANKKWFSPDAAADAARSRRGARAAGSIGLADRNGDGMLEDASGRPARFTLVTQKGRPRLERGVRSSATS